MHRSQTDGPILGVLHGKEYDKKAQCDACVKASREDVVVSHPPSEVETAHEPLEDKSSHDPRGVVDSGSRWYGANAGEEHWYIDVSPKGEWVATSEEVEWDRCHSADQEEPQQRVVPVGNGSGEDKACRTTDTHILPGLNNRPGPTPPQIIDAEANVFVDGHEKPSGWLSVQKSLMLANIQSCTRVTTKQLTNAATTCAVNMMRGGIFI